MANIIHFGKYYLPNVGGIESVTVSLAEGAVAAGHSVSVICFEKNPKNRIRIVNGVQVIATSILKVIKSQPFGIGYFLECFEASKTADIVHLHLPNMLGALCGLFVSRKSRLLVHWHSDVVNKGFIGKILRPLELAILWRADKVVTTSQIYADASNALVHYSKKIIVVPIGAPDLKKDESDLLMPELVNIKAEGYRIILAVGRLVTYKGFDVLIKSAKYLLPKSVIVIVGDGVLRGELRRIIHNENCSDRVILKGRLSVMELSSLFKVADIYCLPSTSRAEAFGVVLLEAMAHGLPIIATNIPGSGVSWVNQHDVSGLNVPVGDSMALATACNELLSSEELRCKLAKGARQRYLAEFTEQKSLQKMLDVYENLF